MGCRLLTAIHATPIPFELHNRLRLSSQSHAFLLPTQTLSQFFSQQSNKIATAPFSRTLTITYLKKMLLIKRTLTNITYPEAGTLQQVMVQNPLNSHNEYYLLSLNFLTNIAGGSLNFSPYMVSDYSCTCRDHGSRKMIPEEGVPSLSDEHLVGIGEHLLQIQLAAFPMEGYRQEQGTIIRPIPSTLRNIGQMLPKVGSRIGNPTTSGFLRKFQISAALILDLRPLQY